MSNYKVCYVWLYMWSEQKSLKQNAKKTIMSKKEMLWVQNKTGSEHECQKKKCWSDCYHHYFVVCVDKYER